MLDVRIDDGLRHMDWIERQLAETHRLETEAAWAGKVSLNRELYRAVAAAGNLLFAGAFDRDELVGYCSAFISRHPHYDCLMCQHDALFLLPEYRVGMAGLRLVQTIERECGRNGGVQRLCLGGVGIKGGLGCLFCWAWGMMGSVGLCKGDER